MFDDIRKLLIGFLYIMNNAAFTGMAFANQTKTSKCQILRTCLDGTIGGSFDMLGSGQRPHVLGPRAGIMEPGLNMDSFIGPDCLLPVFWCSACITCHN